MGDPKRDAQACAAELLAGLVRGAGHWPLSHQKALWASLKELLAKALRSCSVESLQDWQNALRYIAFNRDPRRIVWLVELLATAAEGALQQWLSSGGTASTTDTSLAQANTLRFLAPLLVELSWRGLPLIRRLLRGPVMRTWATHPYKQVREEVRAPPRPPTRVLVARRGAPPTSSPSLLIPPFSYPTLTPALRVPPPPSATARPHRAQVGALLSLAMLATAPPPAAHAALAAELRA